MRVLRWLLLPTTLLTVACSGSGGTDPGGSAGSVNKAGSGGSGQAGSSSGGTSSGGTSSGGTSGASAGGNSGTAGAGGSGEGGSAGSNAAGTSGDGGSAGQPACGGGQEDCDNNPANGCETNVSSDALHCGACGTACPPGENATGVCIQGACSLACNGGRANCDNDLSNGCETNLQNDGEHCGFCGNTCASQDGTPTQCVGGVCMLQCAGTTLDCNQNPADGCEINTSNDPQNCGLCGNSCNGGQCVQGTCECAGTSAEAQAVQLAMFVMLDKSGSMLDTIAGGSSRWEAVKQALNQFFASAEASGIKVALNYFPLQDPGGTACGNGYYYNPAVPMAALPGPGNAQVTALSDSMNATTPSGGTPTQVALGAALQYASDWKQVFPKDKTIVVLATDGQPGDGCGATLENSTAAATAGFGGDPSVPTYVIGVGSLTANLDSIASAGGTTKAFPVDDGNTSAFIEALKQIKLQAVACEYALPTPPNGTSFNPSKVNFEYSPGGGQPEILGNASDAASCDPAKGGWYYDDPVNPSKILLCPASCSTLQADTAAKVNILLGCDTIKE